jgi:hypothetical protein
MAFGKFSIVVIAISIFLIGIAQVNALLPVEIWNKTFSGPYENNFDEAHFIQATNDNNFIIVGNMGQWKGVSDPYSGVAYIWLIKVDNSGNKIWDKTFGAGDINERGNYVQQTSDGGFIVCGWKRDLTTNVMQAIAIKTDANGEKQWERDSEIGLVAYSVSQTPNGGYFILGEGEGQTAAGGYSPWVAQLESSGTIDWEKTLGSDLTPSDIIRTQDGGYLVVGGRINTNMNYIIKFNSDESLKWQKPFDVQFDPFAASVSIRETKDNSYLIFINSEVSYLVKTSDDGNIVSEKKLSEGTQYTWGGNEIFFSETKDGGYIFPVQSPNPSLIKTDANGTEEWQYNESLWFTGVFDVLQTADGGFIQTGSVCSSSGDCSSGSGRILWISRLSPEQSQTTQNPTQQNGQIRVNETAQTTITTPTLTIETSSSQTTPPPLNPVASPQKSPTQKTPISIFPIIFALLTLILINKIKFVNQ